MFANFVNEISTIATIAKRADKKKKKHLFSLKLYHSMRNKYVYFGVFFSCMLSLRQITMIDRSVKNPSDVTIFKPLSLHRLIQRLIEDESFLNFSPINIGEGEEEMDERKSGRIHAR